MSAREGVPERVLYSFEFVWETVLPVMVFSGSHGREDEPREETVSHPSTSGELQDTVPRTETVLH